MLLKVTKNLHATAALLTLIIKLFKEDDKTARRTST